VEETTPFWAVTTTTPSLAMPERTAYGGRPGMTISRAETGSTRYTVTRVRIRYGATAAPTGCSVMRMTTRFTAGSTSTPSTAMPAMTT